MSGILVLLYAFVYSLCDLLHCIVNMLCQTAVVVMILLDRITMTLLSATPGPLEEVDISSFLHLLHIGGLDNLLVVE